MTSSANRDSLLKLFYISPYSLTNLFISTVDVSSAANRDSLHRLFYNYINCGKLQYLLTYHLL